MITTEQLTPELAAEIADALITEFEFVIIGREPNYGPFQVGDIVRRIFNVPVPFELRIVTSATVGEWIDQNQIVSDRFFTGKPPEVPKPGCRFYRAVLHEG